MSTKIFAETDGIEACKEYLINHLDKGLCRFAFIKKDGSTREMLATTNLSMVPDQFQPAGTKSVFTPSNMKRVFDIVTNGWRIVTLDKLLWVEKE